MNETPSKPTLNQLIDEAREGATEQHAATPSQRSSPLSVKTIFGWLVLMVFVIVLFIQYPRIQAPYDWPAVNSNPVMAEADLEAVAGFIEAYRLSQGQYPSVLSQVALPEGLVSLIARSVLVYSPADTAYTLDWTLEHWHATYDSKIDKFNVKPLGKH